MKIFRLPQLDWQFSSKLIVQELEQTHKEVIADSTIVSLHFNRATALALLSL